MVVAFCCCGLWFVVCDLAIGARLDAGCWSLFTTLAIPIIFICMFYLLLLFLKNLNTIICDGWELWKIFISKDQYNIFIIILFLCYFSIFCYFVPTLIHQAKITNFSNKNQHYLDLQLYILECSFWYPTEYL